MINWISFIIGGVCFTLALLIIVILSNLFIGHADFQIRTKEERKELDKFDKQVVRFLKTMLKNKILRYEVFDYK